MGSVSHFQPIMSALFFGNVFLSVYFGLEWDGELNVSSTLPPERIALVAPKRPSREAYGETSQEACSQQAGFPGLGEVSESAFPPFSWTPGRVVLVVAALKPPWYLIICLMLFAGLGCQLLKKSKS